MSHIGKLALCAMIVVASPRAGATVEESCKTGYSESSPTNVIAFPARKPRPLDDFANTLLESLKIVERHVTSGTAIKLKPSDLSDFQTIWKFAEEFFESVQHPANQVSREILSDLKFTLDKLELSRNEPTFPSVLRALELPPAFARSIVEIKTIIEVHRLSKNLVLRAGGLSTLLPTLRLAFKYLHQWSAEARIFIGPNSKHDVSSIIEVSNEIELAYLTPDRFLKAVNSLSRFGFKKSSRTAAREYLRELEHLRVSFAYIKSNGHFRDLVNDIN